ncbi:MAG: hypothetical protein R3265_14380, partial [Hyphomonas sp.]|nr:hypothetical protein [Hyphomonas sp.]
VEAAKMSALVSLVLNVPRYLLVTGLTVLALVYFSPYLRDMGADADYEAILPFALREFIPVGLLGLTLAGLLAAFMSSFAAPLNAAPAYVVNDIYRKYIRPDASETTYLRISYLVSTLFVIIGTLFGLFLTSIDDVINWITAGLYGGYTAANVVKWYWWRMNGYGYFWGMLTGILFALGLGLPLVDINPLQAFPFLFAACLVAVAIGSLATRPTEMETLEHFYLKTRPWGLWGPVADSLAAKGRTTPRNPDLKRDLLNVSIGIVWQTALICVPIFLIIQDWPRMFVSLAVVVATSIFLKLNWYHHLRDYPADYAPTEERAS